MLERRVQRLPQLRPAAARDYDFDLPVGLVGLSLHHWLSVVHSCPASIDQLLVVRT